MSNANNHPLPKFHFIVDWGGSRIGFTEVSGLSFETEVIEYRDGASKSNNKLKIPGLVKYGNVTLKRGVFLNDFEFFAWWQSTAGSGFRRDVSIQLLNDEHSPILSWRLKNAWPCKLNFASLNAQANEVLIETLELTHEGLIIQT